MVTIDDRDEELTRLRAAITEARAVADRQFELRASAVEQLVTAEEQRDEYRAIADRQLARENEAGDAFNRCSGERDAARAWARRWHRLALCLSAARRELRDENVEWLQGVVEDRERKLAAHVAHVARLEAALREACDAIDEEGSDGRVAHWRSLAAGGSK